jgi:hypothetical protein
MRWRRYSAAVRGAECRGREVGQHEQDQTGVGLLDHVVDVGDLNRRWVGMSNNE